MTDYERILTEQGLDISDMMTVPEHFDADSWTKKWQLRELMVRSHSFAILTSSAMDFLRPYAPILEIGSGTGYWAMELQKANIDVIATDKEPGCEFYFDGKQWVEMTRIEASIAVNRFPRKTLLVCWPEHGESWANEALKAFSGEYVIFVGEEEGGCTADHGFFETLYSDWKPDAGFSIPQWPGLHDCISVYHRHQPTRKVNWQ